MAEQVRLRGGQHTWTEEHDALLRQFWKEGFSCSQTALKLIEAGCPARTRNAIIGRVHRLGLPRRGFSNASNRTYQSRREFGGVEQSRSQRRAASRKAKKSFCKTAFGTVSGKGEKAGYGYESQQKAFARALAKPEPVAPLNTPLCDTINVATGDKITGLEWGMCRAVSDTSTWGKPLYCGHACGETESFCAAHKARFFQPLKPRARHASKQSRADRARYRDSARWAGL